MRISVNWIRDYIDVSLSIPRLIEELNSIGLLIEEWEEKGGDVILDLETYANRPDTLGHMGVARELAAKLGLPIKEQTWPLTELEEKTSDLVDIQIWDGDLCPRYSGIIVKGVQLGTSPDWLIKKIEAMGLKPINNVVDVSNYVLFATAQPIHIFDLAKIGGRKIIIRRAKKGEILRSLEGEDIHLSHEMLVIADDKKPIALAGIIGGEESAVSEYTRDVFIESAYFDPVSVRKTNKKAGIQTDASYRFERGTDISFSPQAALMAASFLTQIGGEATKGIKDVYPKPKKSKTVVLRNHRVSELLGVDVDEDFIEKTLTDLGFQVELQQQGIWRIKIPFFRIDIEREADLIEEIARFYGFDRIPARIPPLKTLEPVLDQKRRRVNRLRQLLFHYGFDEVVNYSFFDPEKEAIFETSRKAVRIRNPISSRASLLKTTLIGGLLENIVWNRNRGAEGVHIFEAGKIYFSQDETCVEQLMLALVTSGFVGTTHWQTESEKADFFQLKGTCEDLMADLHYEPFSFQEENHPFFQQGYSLSLHFKGKAVGYLGLLKEDILDSYSLKDPVWAAELNLNELFERQPQSFLYSPVIKYPSMSRDVSFIADQDVVFQEIKEVVERLSIPYLEKFELYDRFSGPFIPKDKISLSFRFIFRHPKRTLLTEEVDNLQQKIINALKTSFNIQLREGGKIDK